MNFNQIKNILRTKRVGIAGCGGLGSNCAVALVRSGVGQLVIADFDRVEESNLNRQYFFADQLGQPKTEALKHNLLRIRPETTVEAHFKKLDAIDIPYLFANCDVIVEAFDGAQAKQMIIETVAEELPGTPLVSGMGMAGWGKSESIKLQQYGNLYLCGDGETEVSEELPPIAPRVGMVANMQANTVLEILLECSC